MPGRYCKDFRIREVGVRRIRSHTARCASTAVVVGAAGVDTYNASVVATEEEAEDRNFAADGCSLPRAGHRRCWRGDDAVPILVVRGKEEGKWVRNILLSRCLRCCYHYYCEW
jgi:hypothetical protein